MKKYLPTDRERIFAEIRRRLGGEDSAIPPPPPSSEWELPKESPTNLDSLAARFIEKAESSFSTTAAAKTTADIPRLAREYLEVKGIPPRIVCAPTLANLNWKSAGIDAEFRAAKEDDEVGITGVLCAVAETGSLITASGADNPLTISLLPPMHIAVVWRAQMVATLENAWQRLFAESAVKANPANPVESADAFQLQRGESSSPNSSGGESSFPSSAAARFNPPRQICFISGPSRTADIEQTLTLGMHGPLAVHIIIADEN